jgi:hypothetical protein
MTQATFLTVLVAALLLLAPSVSLARSIDLLEAATGSALVSDSSMSLLQAAQGSSIKAQSADKNIRSLEKKIKAAKKVLAGLERELEEALKSAGNSIASTDEESSFVFKSQSTKYDSRLKAGVYTAYITATAAGEALYIPMTFKSSYGVQYTVTGTGKTTEAITCQGKEVTQILSGGTQYCKIPEGMRAKIKLTLTFTPTTTGSYAVQIRGMSYKAGKLSNPVYSSSGTQGTIGPLLIAR